MTEDENYISRCLQLASLGIGNVAPNPMVGAVLIFEKKIIGEGYHQKYGGPHAEVNCINSVKEEDRYKIEHSTLYVSLEPCAHHGKTPPCADLIIKNNIKKVFIGCKDVYKEVAGKGILKLQNAGVYVVSGVLEKECRNINNRFFTFHEKFRPYIILKWAQSINGIIGSGNDERILISNEYSNRLVHKWRSEEAAILIGTNSAFQDNPQLTTRHWKGKSPVRIVIDNELKLPSTSKIFNKEATTIIFNLRKNDSEGNIVFVKLGKENFVDELLHVLFEMNIQSVLIEGGAKTLESFIDLQLWDEARIITSEKLMIAHGIASPALKDYVFTKQERYLEDFISYYENKANT